MPTTPHSAAGWRMLPPVSEPSAYGASPAATAAADPPEEPPGTRSRSHGLRVGKNAEFSVEEPIANSSMFVLPTITAPASNSRRTTVASYGATKCSSIFEPQVVGAPRVTIRSLIATGTPSSGPRSPAPSRRSASSAWASACSPVTVMNARTRASTAAMRSSAACVSSRELTCLPASSSAHSWIVRKSRSGMLLEHRAHAKVALLGQRRHLEHRLARQRGARGVVREDVLERQRMRRRLDAFGVHASEHVEVPDDLVELRAERLDLVVRQVDARQARDVEHGLALDAHARRLPGARPPW